MKQGKLASLDGFSKLWENITAFENKIKYQNQKRNKKAQEEGKKKRVSKISYWKRWNQAVILSQLSIRIRCDWAIYHPSSRNITLSTAYHFKRSEVGCWPVWTSETNLKIYIKITDVHCICFQLLRCEKALVIRRTTWVNKKMNKVLMKCYNRRRKSQEKVQRGGQSIPPKALVLTT